MNNEPTEDELIDIDPLIEPARDVDQDEKQRLNAERMEMLQRLQREQEECEQRELLTGGQPQ